MTIQKTFLQKLKKLLFVALTSLPLIACAGMEEKPGDGNHDHGGGGKPNVPGNNISDYEFSFSLNDKKGIVPTVRRKGDKKPPIEGEIILPGQNVKSSSIEEVQTITIIRAKGSHFLMINIAGVNYRFDLPPPHP